MQFYLKSNNDHIKTMLDSGYFKILFFRTNRSFFNIISFYNTCFFKSSYSNIMIVISN